LLGQTTQYKPHLKEKNKKRGNKMWFVTGVFLGKKVDRRTENR